MFRNLRLISAAALVLSALAPSLAGAATYHYRSVGDSAYASFYETDSTGCVWTYTDLHVSAGRSQSAPGPGTEPSTWMDLYVYSIDYCQYTDTTSVYVSAPLPADAFRTQGALQSGSLQAAVEAYDWVTGASVPVSIALAWTGEGEVTRGHNSFHGMYPGVRYTNRSIGSSRPAIPAGSITLGAKSLSTANGYGSLSTNQVNNTTISHHRP